jgi:hypothetical protein
LLNKLDLMKIDSFVDQKRHSKHLVHLQNRIQKEETPTNTMHDEIRNALGRLKPVSRNTEKQPVRVTQLSNNPTMKYALSTLQTNKLLDDGDNSAEDSDF